MYRYNINRLRCMAIENLRKRKLEGNITILVRSWLMAFIAGFYLAKKQSLSYLSVIYQ